MSTDSTLKHVTTSIKEAKLVTSKVNEWAEKATKFSEEGKELSEIQGMLKDVTAFGKASIALRSGRAAWN